MNRQAQLELARALQAGLRLAPKPPSPYRDRNRSALQRLDLAIMRKTLELASPRQRQVIELWYIDGYSLAEVAEILRISESAVNAHRARFAAKIAKLTTLAP